LGCAQVVLGDLLSLALRRPEVASVYYTGVLTALEEDEVVVAISGHSYLVVDIGEH
jgi:hypothetical protein